VPPLRLLFLIAAFCRLAKSLSHCQQMGWLVGAVGIENNDVRNFKDLRGMRRNTKSLKRNKRARKGILIAPSKLPRFLCACDSNRVGFSPTTVIENRPRPKFSGADGRPILWLEP
jgi:hypothetical protein